MRGTTTRSEHLKKLSEHIGFTDSSAQDAGVYRCDSCGDGSQKTMNSVVSGFGHTCAECELMMLIENTYELKP